MAEQIERQLTILSFLEWEKNGLTENEIRKRLIRIGMDVSISTLRRDIDHISLAKIPIYEEKINGNVRYKLGKYKMENLNFSFEEIIGLYLLKDMISPLTHDEIWKRVNKIVDTIISKVPKRFKKYSENLNTTEVVTNYKYLDKVDNSMYKLISDSIVNKRCIKIKHMSYDKKTTVREVNPYKIIFEKGMYYLIAYCHLRNEIRNFKLNRIIDIDLTNHFFNEIRFDYNLYKKSKFINLYGKQNDKYQVKIRFKGDKAKYFMEYDLKKAYKFEKEEKDIIFYRTVGELKDIKKWILSYGSDVEVLEPKELKEEIFREVEFLYKQYKK